MEKIILISVKLLPTIAALTVSAAYIRNAHYERTVLRFSFREPWRLKYDWKAAYINDVVVAAVSAVLGVLLFKLFVL